MILLANFLERGQARGIRLRLPIRKIAVVFAETDDGYRLLNAGRPLHLNLYCTPEAGEATMPRDAG